MSTPDEFIPPSIEEIAALLPAYDIKSFIAKGGMGAVYMASQRSLDRLVAIKILPRKFGEDQTFRESFEKEAKSMAKFNHPNLVSIYDFGQIDGMLYIIMEMIHGKPLFYSCYGKKIAADEANRIIVEVCNGLQHAHEHGILHRDIKPANILLDASVSPKIGDFGLARGVTDHASDQAFGTPGYTAPEVIYDPTAVRECTDIYSVGVMLYELLTSKIPETPYIPVTSIIKCNPQYDQIILKAISENPSARYQSASEMSEALINIHKSAPTAKPATRFATPSVGAVAKSPPISRFENSGNNTTTRNMIIIAGLAAVIVAAWQGLKLAEDNREAENERIELLEQQDKAAKKAAIATERSQKKLNNTNPKFQKPTTTNTKSLEELKSDLKNGLRKEMPKGVISKNGRSRLYVEKEMSWYGASRYAERYGAHIAVFPSVADLNSFSSTIEANTPIWVGAGSAGDNKWQWIDGSKWNHQVRRSSDLSFLTVNKFGILSPAKPTKKHSFYIEWLDDGSQPALLSEQIKRASASLGTDTPQYPAGTVSYDGKHYLLARNRNNWHDAKKSALNAGGHLAIPSNKQENEWMVSFVAAELGVDGACWIGGSCKTGKDWKWQTGEPWTFATWKPGKPNTSDSDTYACAINVEKTWSDFKASEELPYMLIEWSESTANTGGSPDEITSMKLKCRQLVETIISDNELAFINNTKSLNLDFIAFQSRLTKEAQQVNQPIIDKMLASAKNNRLRSKVKGSMSEKLADIYQVRVQKQNILQAQVLEKVENIRTHYIKKLEGIAQAYEEKGQISNVKHAQHEIEMSTKNKRNFVDYILK